MALKPKSIALESLLAAFSQVPDPRVARTRAHPLVNVLTMSFFGAISGAEGWDDLEIFAEERADFFGTFLELPEGATPCADTFRRVFEALDPAAFQLAFRAWLKPLLDNLEGQTVAMDGKALRGALAHARRSGGAFHLMHVWAAERHLLLGQQAVEGAPGEVQAAIELLQLLDLHGATVTADANSCSAAVTAAVREAGADYVLALKGNRSALHQHVEQLFAEAEANGYPGVKQFDSSDAAHGRIEHRIVRAMPLGTLPTRMKAAWTDLRSAVMIHRIRATDHVSVGRAYYVTSHRPNAKHLAGRIREHWSIENQLHHSLDVSFGDDRRKIHSEHGAQNFALLARHALSLLKRQPSKMSLAQKRRRAAWGPQYLLKVLACGFNEV